MDKVSPGGHRPVTVTPLKQYHDEKGGVLHMLRADSPLFRRFGEVYFSIINPGIVKGWKRHSRMMQHFACPEGRVKLVFFDNRDGKNSSDALTVEEIGRPDRYNLIQVPPMVWYSFKCVSLTASLLANCTDLPHTPEESEEAALDSDWIPWSWENGSLKT
ncbi:dTDP-4-dehydrorhamnose 3,5-epimerase [Fibrobacterota bacterium]